MSADEGFVSRDVPDHPRDREDLKARYVIVDVRVRDGNKFHGFKDYVEREDWEAADEAARVVILKTVAAKLAAALEGGERERRSVLPPEV